MAIRTFRVVRPVWIAFLVVVALSFASRAEASVVEAHGPPVGNTCEAALYCASLEIDAFTGDGSGTVTSTPVGISCTSTNGVRSGTTCKHTFTWDFGSTRTVTLTATPAAGSLAQCGPEPQESPCTLPITLFPGDIALMSVHFELKTYETFSVELTLVRAGKTLASRKTGKLKEGDRLITLPVPNAVKKGKATLQIVFTDSVGNTQTVKRGVRLGKA